MTNLFDIISKPLYIKIDGFVRECRVINLTFFCSDFISNCGIIDISKSSICDFVIEYADLQGNPHPLIIDEISIKDGIYDNIVDCNEGDVKKAVLFLDKRFVITKHLVTGESRHIGINKILDIYKIDNCCWADYKGGLFEHLFTKLTGYYRQCLQTYRWNGKKVIKDKLNPYIFIYDAITKKITINEKFNSNGFYSSEYECHKDLLEKNILNVWDIPVYTINTIYFNKR